MLIGALGYFVSFTLFALQRTQNGYWPFLFPGLTLIVLGADLQFNVANMFVMSAMPPAQQSLAGGIIQTGTRLAGTIGLGISTAVFNAVQASPPSSGFYAGDEAAAYAAVFWFSAAITAVSVGLVPFLRVGTQGGAVESVPPVGAVGAALAVADEEKDRKPGAEVEVETERAA